MSWRPIKEELVLHRWQCFCDDESESNETLDEEGNVDVIVATAVVHSFACSFI